MDVLTPILLLSTVFCGLVAVLFIYGKLLNFMHSKSPPVNKKKLEQWLFDHKVALPSEQAIIDHCNLLAETVQPMEGGVQWRKLKVECFLPNTALPEFEVLSIKSMDDQRMDFTCCVSWPDCVPGLEVSVLLGDEKVTCHLQVDWMLMFARGTLTKLPDGGVVLSWEQTNPPASSLSCMVIDPPHLKAEIDFEQPLMENPNAKASEGVASSIAEGILTMIKLFTLDNFSLVSVNYVYQQTEEDEDLQPAMVDDNSTTNTRNDITGGEENRQPLASSTVSTEEAREDSHETITVNGATTVDEATTIDDNSKSKDLPPVLEEHGSTLPPLSTLEDEPLDTTVSTSLSSGARKEDDRGGVPTEAGDDRHTVDSELNGGVAIIENCKEEDTITESVQDTTTGAAVTPDTQTMKLDLTTDSRNDSPAATMIESESSKGEEQQEQKEEPMAEPKNDGGTDQSKDDSKLNDNCKQRDDGSTVGEQVSCYSSTGDTEDKIPAQEHLGSASSSTDNTRTTQEDVSNPSSNGTDEQKTALVNNGFVRAHSDEVHSNGSVNTSLSAIVTTSDKNENGATSQIDSKWLNGLPTISTGTTNTRTTSTAGTTSSTGMSTGHSTVQADQEDDDDDSSNRKKSSLQSSWRHSFEEELQPVEPNLLSTSLTTPTKPMPTYVRVRTYSEEDLTAPDKSPFDRSKTLSIRSYDTDSPMIDASGRFLSTVVFEVHETSGRSKHIVALNPAHASRLRKQLGKYTKLHIYNDHTFIAKHIKSKQTCAVCKDKISGLFGKQAYECRDCCLLSHKNCHHKTESTCSRSQVSTLNLIYPDNITSFSSKNSLK